MSSHKGYVYILHFEEKMHHAQHYIGWSKEYPDADNARIGKHKNGTSGVKIVDAFLEKGIEFRVARIYEDVDGKFERKLKNQKNAPKLCPICQDLKKNGGR